MSSPAPEILLLTELYPPTVGGSAVLFENIYSRLDEIPVEVLTAGEGDAREQCGLRVRTMPMAAADWGLLAPDGLWRHLRVARAVRRILPAESGVVHCGRALPEGLSALMSGRPYWCWTHGEELGFASSSRELTWLMRRVYRRARGVLANSRNSAGLLAKDWGVEPERIAVVYPGVDPVRFNPDADPGDWRRRYAPNGEVLFLSVGRLQPRKGHDVAVQALSSLSDLPVRYLIAGDGPARADLEAKVRASGLTDRVVFLGPIGDTELPSLYTASDVFLMPNRQEGVDFEGFGIVFLEAAACGRAAIGGRSGGVSEAVEGDVTGLLVDGQDVAAVAAAMRRLAADPSMRQRLGIAGRTRVERLFGWDQGAAGVARVHQAWKEAALRAG